MVKDQMPELNPIEPAPRGRPSELTPEAKARVELVFGLDGTKREAAYYAGCSASTLNRWLDSDPEWAEHCEMLREKPILKARQAVVKNLDDPEFALKYLSKKRKDEFADRTEHTGKNGEAIAVKGFNYVQPNATNNTDNPTHAQTAPGVGNPA